MMILRHTAALLAACAMAALPASAAPPVAASTTVDLHIDAIGMAVPDFAVAPVTVNGSGTTREAAEALLAERRDTMMKALAGLGVPADKVKLGSVKAVEVDLSCYDTMCSGDDGIAVPVAEIPEGAFLKDVAGAAASEAAADDSDREATVRVVSSASPMVENLILSDVADPYDLRRAHMWVATSDGTVQVDDIARVTEVGAAVSANGRWSASTTTYEFIDRPKAHKAALADGLRRARAEADSYAASIGYRVLRIKGMTNTAAPFSVTDIFTMMSRTEGPGKDNKFMQSDFAPVGVDFVLVAK